MRRRGPTGGGSALLGAAAADALNLVPDHNSPGRFLDIGRDLSRRGHAGRRIDKILGGKFARLFGEAWSA